MTYRKSEAFTLIEVLIAITVVGIITTALMGPIRNYFKRSRIETTKIAMKNIKTALMLYQNDKGNYPTTSDGLEVLVPDYLDSEKSIRDAWNREFEYNAPPVQNKKYKHWELISYGEGGEDDERDNIETGQ